MSTALIWCTYTARGILEYLPITRSWFAAELSRCLDKMADVNSVDLIKNALFMPRLAICSRDLHWHWINWTLPCDTMEVSMLRLTWLTTAQHVFQPALTGRLELVSRKIVSRGPRTKAIAVSKFREKLSPANWIQGVTAISRKISRSWAPKNGVQHATAIYPIPRYTRPRYIGLTLYYFPPARPKELLIEEKGWLTDVGHNSWWHMKCAQYAAHKGPTHMAWRCHHLRKAPTWSSHPGPDR